MEEKNQKKLSNDDPGKIAILQAAALNGPQPGGGLVDEVTSNYILSLIDQAIDSAVSSTTDTNTEITSPVVPEDSVNVSLPTAPPGASVNRNQANNNNSNNNNKSKIININNNNNNNNGNQLPCDSSVSNANNIVCVDNDDNTTKLVSAVEPSSVVPVNLNFPTDNRDNRISSTTTAQDGAVKQIETVIETDKPLTESNPKSDNDSSSTSFTYVNQCFEMDPVVSGIPASTKPSQQEATLPSSSSLSSSSSSTTFSSAAAEATVATVPVSTISEITATTGSALASRASLPLPSINIMDEFGQQTETISIDGNNNDELNDKSATIDITTTGSTPSEDELNSAVWVKNVSFCYTKKVDILSQISLTVPRGKIYALLGSSGCGKTTLLRLILGRIQQRRGDIRVFGAKPGGIHSNIPGSGVGYMPQDLALVPTFTIEETFNYYGTLHHMSKDMIRQRINFFIEFLNLPPRDRKIGQSSGGQQRRVSIAVTLFHSPPLLILDEPTVGVDPLLRCKIWQYLEQICVNNGMTVIITTHYIEESRNASTLAFMRFGRILAQDSPEKLLQKYHSTVLEDVFLKLCQQDCGEIKQKYSLKNKKRKASLWNAFGGPDDDENLKQLEPVRSKFHTLSVDSRRMNALFYKNLLTLRRNPLIMMFYVVLPIIQISLFCYSVVKEPDHIPISVYNGESKGFSKRYLSMLDTHTLKIKHYGSHDEAVQAVIDGKSWAAISMMSNFTKAYRRRAKNPSDLDDDDFESSKIRLYVDTSDNFLYMAVYQSLLNSYKDFVESVAESFGFSRSTVQLPIDVKGVIYGHYDPKQGYDLINNLGTNCMVAIIYTTPLILGAFLIVLERKGGIIERTMVSGATSIEIILSHMICMMGVLVLQVALLMMVSFMVFEIRNDDGSLIELFIFFYMQGLCGIFLGLSLSSIAKNETVALVSSFALIFPVWMMSGVFWPLESIPPILQDVFWVVPLSVPIRCINHITKRAWSYEDAYIQMGYCISIFYNTIFFILGITVFHWTAK